MKKILFILAFVMLASFFVKGQTTPENYYLPDFIDVENCASLLFYDETGENTLNYMARNHYSFYNTGSNFDIIQILDRAQPCYTDTLLTVQGIAIGVDYKALLQFSGMNYYYNIALLVTEERYTTFANNPIGFYNSIPKGKLKLMNSTLDREITSVDIDTNFVLKDTEQYTYIEYYFNEPVNVNGLFYIVEDATNNSTVIQRIVFSECDFAYSSLVRTADDTASTWVQWSEHPFNQGLQFGAYGYSPSRYPYSDFFNLSHAADSPTPNSCQMYMFPIFAETDTTLGDGIYPSVCLYDATVDRYSNVSPNPANDVVTVQSSFKIREIEIHNSLGQVVLRKEGKQNIETIDVSHLESGMYIVRIKTQRGFANKKVIIQ